MPLALKHLSSEVEFIAIHDAARPALENDLFERLLMSCKQLDAVVPALPLTSTVKRVSDRDCTIGDEDAIADSILGESTQTKVDACLIESTEDRSTLWATQNSPDLFKRR